MRNIGIIKNFICFCALPMVCALFLACPIIEEPPEEDLLQKAADDVLAALGTEVGSAYTVDNSDNANGISFSITGGSPYTAELGAKLVVTSPNTGFSVSNPNNLSGSSSIKITTEYLVNNTVSYPISVTVKGVVIDDPEIPPVYSSGSKTLEISAVSLGLVIGTINAFKNIMGKLTPTPYSGGTLGGGTITYEAGSVGTLNTASGPVSTIISGAPVVLVTDINNNSNIKASGIGTLPDFADKGSFSLGSISLPGTLAITDAGSAGTAHDSSEKYGTFVVTFGGASSPSNTNAIKLNSGGMTYILNGAFSTWVTVYR
ncbi:MAG: hypothetical protein LBC27_03535 [Spirochaetaceae bacterium]|jgi:hypothetical protein|nr:hypothetical protein [Spirochaetaceae bacterium]